MVNVYVIGGPPEQAEEIRSVLEPLAEFPAHMAKCTIVLVLWPRSPALFAQDFAQAQAEISFEIGRAWEMGKTIVIWDPDEEAILLGFGSRPGVHVLRQQSEALAFLIGWIRGRQDCEDE